MKLDKKICVVFFGLALILNSCGNKNTTEPERPTYENYIQKGWEYFEGGEYQNALNEFEKAVKLNDSKVDAYCGSGWSYLMLDSLDAAVSEFAEGQSKSGDRNDLFAGWAFTLNALKQYSNSNDKIAIISDIENWEFSYGIEFNVDHLYLLSAMNYFAIGNLTESLSYVQKIDASYTADVSTAEGQMSLAEKIEVLKGYLS